jgi:hypothetical protein
MATAGIAAQAPERLSIEAQVAAPRTDAGLAAAVAPAARDESFQVAHRVHNRGGRTVVVTPRRNRYKGAAIAGGIAAAAAAAIILSQGANASEPRRGGGGYGNSCRRWLRACDDGEGWACRKYRRECY